MNADDCPYEILGVSKDATESDIKKAYRKLALKNHPDKQTTDEDRLKAQTVFSKIANAYEILSDPEEREQYDLRKKYGGAPGTRYTTTKSSPNGGFPQQQTYSSQPQYSSTPRRTSTTNTRRTSTGAPSSTSYSVKDGQYKATVTTDDGRTYTFQGTANGFQDPFEVFRQAFQDKTGEDLPTNMGKPKQSTTTTKRSSMPNMMKNNHPPMPPMQTTQRRPTGTRTSITTNGNMKTITKTETLPDGTTRTSVEHVPIDSSSSSSTPTTTTRRRSVPTSMMMQQPQMKMMSPNMMTPNGKSGGQPMGRSTKTRTVHHDNGTIETITETTETMADGSTRTSSSSKFTGGNGGAMPTMTMGMPTNRTTRRRMVLS